MEECFKMVGALKRAPGDDAQSTNSPTTIIKTIVRTSVMPMPTKTPTSTSVSCISKTPSPLALLTQTTSSSRPPLSHTRPLHASTAKPQFTGGGRNSSSSIVPSVIGVISFVFIVAFILSRRKRRKIISEAIEVESQTVQVEPPSLLPKFWFEKEGMPDGGQKSPNVFVDKFTRLNKPYSPGVRWVADGDITNEKIEPKANFDSESLEPSSSIKATVVNTFITDLPDELAVVVGQKLNVLAEYDDGWMFCSNEKGEQGMVPVECLHAKEEV